MNLSLINVLIVFSNPLREKAYLRLDQEDRDIHEAIKRSKYSERIKITTCHAATVRDLQRALLEDDYHVVQISGHGERKGLMMENRDGRPYSIPQDALAELFSVYREETSSLECVILNTCYSINQGQLISLGVPYTIAMEEAVGDKAAIEFITAFYDAFGAGRSIEFSYKMGCSAVKLLRLNSIWQSKLLRIGETWKAETETHEPSNNAINQASPDTPSIRLQPVKILVGFALDLSDSMLDSIGNKSGEQLSKLEALREKLEQLGHDAKLALERRKKKNLETSVDIFIYGFGLRKAAVCDLLSLIEVACEIFPKERLHDLKQYFRQKIDLKYSQYEGLEEIVKKDFGLGGLVDEFMDLANMRADAEVSRAITREVRKKLENKLGHLGETTLSIEKLMDLWKRSDELLGYAGELIYGDAPLQEALTKVAARFDSELKIRSEDINRILLIVSDGKSSSDNPLPIINRLKKLGVTVVSCFITDRDIIEPRTLIGNLELVANPGAKLMFDAASSVDINHRFAKFFLKKGWTLETDAKLFAQVNHSQALEEFIHVILNPLEVQEEE